MKVIKIKQEFSLKRFSAVKKKSTIKVLIEENTPLTLDQEAKIKAFFETL